MDTETVDLHESSHNRDRKAGREHRNGPAIYIVFMTFIGGVVGMPFAAHKVELSVLAFVFLGAILGGLIYRIRSREWPIDPSARARRYGYALAVTLILPTSIGLLVGTAGQGLGMILLGLCVGVALAAGIIISGDRRFSPMVRQDAPYDPGY